MNAREHHVWLAEEQSRLVSFFEPSVVDDRGGYFWLDESGRATPSHERPLWLAARLVHCFSIEHMLGRPGAADVAEHGIRALLEQFADPAAGGFHASTGPDGTPMNRRKEAYGHAFALLAATSGGLAGLRGSAELESVANAALDHHFWDEADGAAIDSFDESFDDPERYRGQNSNMHLMEAYLAAHEASGGGPTSRFLDRATRIAQRLIDVEARTAGWRVPEHFDADWTVDPQYNADEPDHPFRPYGTLVGHSLEWSRLLLQLAVHVPQLGWATDAAARLFETAVADGWDRQRRGFVYSVDASGRAVNTARMHWTIAEGIGAAVWLRRATGDVRYDDWYTTFWSYAEELVIDREGGSWWHELSTDGTPSCVTWQGKPDLYHAWQATLYARLPSTMGIGAAVAQQSAEGGQA